MVTADYGLHAQLVAVLAPHLGDAAPGVATALLVPVAAHVARQRTDARREALLGAAAQLADCQDTALVALGPGWARGVEWSAGALRELADNGVNDGQ